jgi:hypothetical protein
VPRAIVWGAGGGAQRTCHWQQPQQRMPTARQARRTRCGREVRGAAVQRPAPPPSGAPSPPRHTTGAPATAAPHRFAGRGFWCPRLQPFPKQLHAARLLSATAPSCADRKRQARANTMTPSCLDRSLPSGRAPPERHEGHRTSPSGALTDRTRHTDPAPLTARACLCLLPCFAWRQRGDAVFAPPWECRICTAAGPCNALPRRWPFLSSCNCCAALQGYKGCVPALQMSGCVAAPLHAHRGRLRRATPKRARVLPVGT